jgi:hypothetical protein
MEFVLPKRRKNFGIDVIELRSSGAIFVQNSWRLSPEEPNPFIYTRNSINIFLKGLQKSGMDFNNSSRVI